MDMEARRTLPQDVHQCPLVLLKEPILDQIRVVVTPFQDGKYSHMQLQTHFRLLTN